MEETKGENWILRDLKFPTDVKKIREDADTSNLWEKINEVNLTKLPVGTLVVINGSRVVRIEKNGMINILLWGGTQAIWGRARLLYSSKDFESYTVFKKLRSYIREKGGVLRVGEYIGIPVEIEDRISTGYLSTIKSIKILHPEIQREEVENKLRDYILKLNKDLTSQGTIKLARTVKLIAASINYNSTILSQRGDLSKMQYKDTVQRLGEFNIQNTGSLIEQAKREEDYGEIRLALAEVLGVKLEFTVGLPDDSFPHVRHIDTTKFRDFSLEKFKKGTEVFLSRVSSAEEEIFTHIGVGILANDLNDNQIGKTIKFRKEDSQSVVITEIKIEDENTIYVKTPTSTYKVEISPASSSPVGGIDFTRLPIVTQAITNLKFSSPLKPSSYLSLRQLNLSEEYQAIEKLASSGITPSPERLRSFLQASCLQEKIGEEKDNALGLLADVLRDEESSLRPTKPGLMDILVALESVTSNQQLREIFLGKIN